MLNINVKRTHFQLGMREGASIIFVYSAKSKEVLFNKLFIQLHNSRDSEVLQFIMKYTTKMGKVCLLYLCSCRFNLNADFL